MYLKHWKNLETTLITESCDLPAKLILLIYPTSSLHVNFFIWSTYFLYSVLLYQLFFLTFNERNHICVLKNLLQSFVTVISQCFFQKRAVKGLV